MPTLVQMDKKRRSRGRNRSYDLYDWIEQSLESEKGVYFTAEEMLSLYKVKANSVANAARKDAETLGRKSGRHIKVFVRFYDRDQEFAAENDVPVMRDGDNYLQDLEFLAYLDNTKAAEDGSGDDEEVPAEVEKDPAAV